MSLIDEITSLVDKVESALKRVGDLEAELAAVKDVLAGIGPTPTVDVPSEEPTPAPTETIGPAAGDAQAPAETPQAPQEPTTVPGDAAPEFGTADQVYPPAGDRGTVQSVDVSEPVADPAPAESVPAPETPA